MTAKQRPARGPQVGVVYVDGNAAEIAAEKKTTTKQKREH